MTLAFSGIQISGLRNPGLRSRISGVLSAALEPVQVKPLAAKVTFFDDNGPKGGRAVRCALTVRVPYRPTVRVEHTAETPRLAFDAKYYVAKRLLQGEGAPRAPAREE